MQYSAIINKAHADYGCESIEFDPFPGISPSESGCWVQAWVWVDHDEDNADVTFDQEIQPQQRMERVIATYTQLALGQTDPQDREAVIVDLVCDLMQYCKLKEMDPTKVLETASKHFRAEE